MEKINFNEHIVAELPPEYSGSDKKKTILMDDGFQYLLKLPDTARENDAKVSYINNAISEYIGCKIFASIGMPVQEVTLGKYTTVNNKLKIACACKDLRNPREKLYEAKNWELSDADVPSENRRSISFASIEALAEKIQYISKKDILDRYYDTFVVDALIGNTDRHNGNWGIIISSFPDLNARLSPVYDCASCLCPLYADEQLTENETRRQALNAQSAISDETGHRINYRDYILSGKNEAVNQALIRIVPKINVQEIHDIINDVPYISDPRKEFYCKSIDIRYQEVLVPALQQVLDKSLSYGIDGEKNYDYKRAREDVMDTVNNTPVFGDGVIQVGAQQIPFTKVKSNLILVKTEDNKARAVLSTKNDRNSIPRLVAALNLGSHYELKRIEDIIRDANERAAQPNKVITTRTINQDNIEM